MIAIFQIVHVSVRFFAIVFSGSRNGAIHQHDVRIARHNVASLVSHTQEVCGLAWSPSGTQLASGGNDNVLNIWDVNVQSSGNISEPLHTIADHCAAVKVRRCSTPSCTLYLDSVFRTVISCSVASIVVTVVTKNSFCCFKGLFDD